MEDSEPPSLGRFLTSCRLFQMSIKCKIHVCAYIVLILGELLPAIRMVSSAYLRLLMFLPLFLIPACTSSSPAFHMM